MSWPPCMLFVDNQTTAFKKFVSGTDQPEKQRTDKGRGCSRHHLSWGFMLTAKSHAQIKKYAHRYSVRGMCSRELVCSLQHKQTCGSFWSDPFSKDIDLEKKTWILLFSSSVVRSSVVRESAFSLQRCREKVNPTTGNLSFLWSILMRDNQTLLSWLNKNKCYIHTRNNQHKYLLRICIVPWSWTKVWRSFISSLPFCIQSMTVPDEEMIKHNNIIRKYI